MRMTTRSPPMMTSPFNFPDFDSSSFFQNSFGSPPPPAPPANGTSLLDDQESSAFADFLDKVGSGQESLLMFDTRMPLFDPKLPDPMMWGWQEDSTGEYPFQPTTSLNPTNPTNVVTTPLSSERSTSYALKQEDDSDERRGSAIAPTDIALDPFAVLHSTSPKPSGSTRPTVSQLPGLQWGSDPNFKFTGFNSTGKEHTAKERMLTERAMAMLVNGGESSATTAGNTAVNSPADGRHPAVARDKDEDRVVSPSKRRKSFHKKQVEEEEEEEDESSSSSPQPRSTGRTLSRSDLTSPSQKQKKKKKTKGPKRENLSEAQKRENHIQSEQKRRNLIREGFDDLCNLVPELRGGGYSKSAILIHAANYLEQVDDGNKALRLRVKQLGGTAVA